MSINNKQLNKFEFAPLTSQTSQERPASWKKLSALAEQAANRDTMKVETEQTFYRNDENQTEVDKDNTTQGQ